MTLSGLRGSLQTDVALPCGARPHLYVAKRFESEVEHEKPLNVRVVLNGGGGVGLSHVGSIPQAGIIASLFLFLFIFISHRRLQVIG